MARAAATAKPEPTWDLVLKRNPLYRGSRPHHVDEIDFTTAGDTVQAVETGAADYAEADPLSLAAVGGTRYRSQLHASTQAKQCSEQLI